MLVQAGHIVDRNIFAFKKLREKHLLLNDIKDEAKGTGKWTSQAAI
jgi:6-phosphogluconate dehydrogenase